MFLNNNFVGREGLKKSSKSWLLTPPPWVVTNTNLLFLKKNYSNFPLYLDKNQNIPY